MLDLPEHAAEARERWRALALAAPESPFAWQAAALLRSTYLGLGLAPDRGWPRPEALAEVLKFPERAPLPPDRAEEAAKGALAWLLGAQLQDGSWLLPSQISTAVGLGQDPFVDAVAALAGRALLARGKEEPGAEARAAAGRALAFLQASIARRAAEPPAVLFMDYATWSDSMALHFLADARAADLGGRRRSWRRPPASCSRTSARASRRAAAGATTSPPTWAAPARRRTPSASRPPPRLSALCRAREVGFTVPDELLLPAVGALERMRAEDGTFRVLPLPRRRGGAGWRHAGRRGRPRAGLRARAAGGGQELGAAPAHRASRASSSTAGSSPPSRARR
jgi:hypothetical protein